ncbi:MAG: ferritin family protein [Methanobacteriota archaeon]
MEPMDLSKYGLDDAFLAAIKSEVESKELYSKIGARVKNAFLKDRMAFLAGEEERHRAAMTRMFMTYFPGREPSLPQHSPVPLPEISFDEANPPALVKVFEQAMEAEMAAQSFYLGLAEKVKTDRQVSDTLRYFAAMENNHYRILEAERANAQTYDDYDDFNPMMHSGP